MGGKILKVFGIGHAINIESLRIDQAHIEYGWKSTEDGMK